MEFKHRVLVFALIGLAMGVFAGTVVTAIISTLSVADGSIHLCAPEFVQACGGNELVAFVIQAVLMGLYGVIPMGGAAFYEYEKWSLTKCTLIHYISTTVLYFVIAFTIRWFRIDDYVSNLIFFLCFTAAFFIIWLVNYLVYKVKLEQVNKELNNLKAVAGKQGL